MRNSDGGAQGNEIDQRDECNGEISERSAYQMEPSVGIFEESDYFFHGKFVCWVLWV